MSLREKKRLDTNETPRVYMPKTEPLVLAIERRFGIMSAERYMLSTVNKNIS